MNVHWEHKKRRSAKMSNDHIDDWYTLARANGALGGKLIGAGGGGFLMFYAEDKARLRARHARGRARGGALPLRLRRHQGGGAIVSGAALPGGHPGRRAGHAASAPSPPTMPKSLVDVNGEPFIAHQLRLFETARRERVVVCAGHLGEMTRQYVGDGSQFGLDVAFSFDGPQLLGTAGALKRALPLLGDAFFVLYGDSYLPCDYREVEEAFARSGKLALMTVFRNDDRWDKSNVELDGRSHRHLRQGASDAADAPSGLRPRRDERARPRRRPERASPTTWPRSTRRCSPAGSWPRGRSTERFYEIGSVEGLEETRRYLAAHAVSPTGAHRELRGAVPRRGHQGHRAAGSAGAIEAVVELLADTRARGGRLFVLGVGGSAANASHAVNDFRKIAGIEAYAPTDNVSELTARTNDDGWASVFEGWLRVSRLCRGRSRAGVLGGRRQRREERQPEPRGRAAATPRGSAPGSPASSDATAATPRRSPTRA